MGRWSGHLPTAQQKRLVDKVRTADGIAVLKLYNKTGSDGAAVPFLRGLPESMGVKILRTNTLRSAILMEWLEGPTLDQFVAEGRESEAEVILGQVDAARSTAPFKHPYVIPRLNKRLRQRFVDCKPTLKGTAPAALCERAIAIFEHLVRSMTRETMISGDLHVGAIMHTPDGPRLIDPRGYRADPAADFYKTLVYNPQDLPVDAFMAQVQRRADIFGPAIDEDPLRLIQWGAVLRASRVLYSVRRGGADDAPDPYLSAFVDLAEA